MLDPTVRLPGHPQAARARAPATAAAAAPAACSHTTASSSTSSVLFSLLALLLIYTPGARAADDSDSAPWVPSGPWAEPSALCTGFYANWVEGNAKLYEQGCADALPAGAVVRPFPSDPSPSACVRLCFDYFFPPEESSRAAVGGDAYAVSLNVTALYQSPHVSAKDAVPLCACHHDPVQANGSTPSQECPFAVLEVPTGCLFESEAACDAAPRTGCIGMSRGSDYCCLDARGYHWNTLRSLFPWWACLVIAVLLLLTTLWVRVARTRVLRGGARGTLLSASSHEDIPGEHGVAGTAGAYEALHAEYAAHLLRLADADDADSNGAAGAVPPPPSERTALVNASLSSDPRGGTCPVCLEELRAARCVRLPCAHRLCLPCAQELADHRVARGKIPTCPICRALILTPSLEQAAAANAARAAGGDNTVLAVLP
eukprot:Rhum_TRINITY_DN23183_c0_g1::Rhum_TRINITY_DN23183_c0_g1_i1::g.177337::m.177337